MVFTQHVNINNMAVNEEFMRICRTHPSCAGCPLKTEDINIQGSIIRCETGRAKGDK